MKRKKEIYDCLMVFEQLSDQLFSNETDINCTKKNVFKINLTKENND